MSRIPSLMPRVRPVAAPARPTAPTRSKAILFGLNYPHTADLKLEGCVNDVLNMSKYLSQFGIPCDVYTDDNDATIASTTGKGIVTKLYELASESFKSNLDFVWIHYSGHGSYTADKSGDERDRRDEALVPTDFQQSGLISDDFLQSIFRCFNPKTRVVCIFDCCHSGTIGDIKYSWEGMPPRPTIENARCAARAPIITLSGCLDNQTAADAYNVLRDNKFSGAMTSCLLIALTRMPQLRTNVVVLLSALRTLLRQAGFRQVPLLCTTHDIRRDARFVAF
jgi:metacaspase-1